MYEPKLITAGVAPIALADAKLHCKQDLSADDAVFTLLIDAVGRDFEEHYHHILTNSTWEYSLDGFFAREIRIPRGPVSAITSIKYVDAADVEHTIPPADYALNAASREGRVYLKDDAIWPAAALRAQAAVTVRFQAGYANAAAIPANIRAGLLLMLAHYYEHRSEVLVGEKSTIDSKRLAVGVQRLWSPALMPTAVVF